MDRKQTDLLIRLLKKQLQNDLIEFVEENSVITISPLTEDTEALEEADELSDSLEEDEEPFQSRCKERKTTSWVYLQLLKADC